MSCSIAASNKTELRQRIDSFLDSLISRIYVDAPYVKNFIGDKKIDLSYYKRYTVEIILRLRLKRTIDALTIHYFTKNNPQLAKLWSEYTADEMLHDALFVKDLESLGLSKADIYATKPFLATKLLQGYFYYGLEHEGRPLASLTSSYFIEYTAEKTQPVWLSKVEESCEPRALKGARAHISHDANDNHTDFVWSVLSSLIENKDDEAKVFEHLEHIYTLFALFFKELHEQEVNMRSSPKERDIQNKERSVDHGYRIKNSRN
ncbi:MAG: iron-containing redox enzyme family protein [Candidatus Obscuribacterales bacterium]|nr:iron-containing redox enzyme family protein [Candidatus Obscuribacterales bacterium]